jgi:hypothetical protein
MGLNESSHAEDLLIAGGKPLPAMTVEEEQRGRRRRNWKGFYGSVHDIVSQSGPCFEHMGEETNVRYGLNQWSYPCEVSPLYDAPKVDRSRPDVWHPP